MMVEWFQSGLAQVSFLAAIGMIFGAAGGGISNYLFPKWLQERKHRLDREAEAHRFALKRQELMFERELAASVDFLKVRGRVVPDSWAPDLDWYDAQTRIAENLYSYERDLKNLLDQHSVSLSEKARNLIGSAKAIANSGSFEVAQETNGDGYEPENGPSDAVRKIVDEFYEAMQNAETQIRRDLQSGTFEG